MAFQNKWLLDKFVMFLGRQIDEYFELNTTRTSACIRWEASVQNLKKEEITISHNYKWKINWKRFKLVYIKEITHRTKSNYLLLRAECEKLSASGAATSLQRLQQTFYEQGEKSGKDLAWQIRQLEIDHGHYIHRKHYNRSCRN